MKITTPTIKRSASVLSAIMALALGACTPPSVTGTDLFTEEAFKLEVIDTVSLRIATVLLDSIDTYKPNRLLLGFHEEELLGKALAAPFFEVGLDTWNYGRPEKEITAFDSLTLVLTYDGYSAFDTTLLQTISVHRLREPMEPLENNLLYNNSFFSYRETDLGSLQFRPRPGSLGEIEVRLSDDFGLELFEKIRDADPALENETAFKSYFAGMVVLPDSSQNAAVLGFTNTPQLRLYYRETSEIPAIRRTITFSCNPTDDDEQFNHIQGDRRNTLFSSLETGRLTKVDSRHTGQVAALQGGTGILTRIEIPYLRSLLELGGDFVIADAQLKIRPILDRAADQFDLPATLEVYWADEDDLISGQNLTPAYLYTDPEFGRDIYYEINIQDFVEQLLSSQIDEQMALLLSFREEAYSTSLNHIVMGNDQHPSKPMELLITLLDLK